MLPVYLKKQSELAISAKKLYIKLNPMLKIPQQEQFIMANAQLSSIKEFKIQFLPASNAK